MKQAGHDATEEMVKNMLKSHDKDGTLVMHAYCAVHMFFVYSFVCLSVCLPFYPFVYYCQKQLRPRGVALCRGKIFPEGPMTSHL